jgi:AcrR family transcriptional regulator
MAVTKKQREAIVEALLALLSERELDRIALTDIAETAGVPLAAVHEAYGSRLAIWEAFATRIDQEVLGETFADMAEEAPRERLFDVMMRRLDALRPHRPALENLMRAARRDPLLALSLNRLAMRSHEWMLAAAGIRAVGLPGRMLVQGSVVTFARVLRVFLDEEDPGMPRTMAALDRELRRAETNFGRILRLCGWSGRPLTGAAPARPGGEPRRPAGNGGTTDAGDFDDDTGPAVA